MEIKKIEGLGEVETPFWKKHFLKLLLALLLIVSMIYGYSSNKSIIKKYEAEISTLKEENIAKIKALNTEHLKQLSYTLALAVRSELIDENLSQIDQYFKQTVKLYGVKKITLVDKNNRKVILSTDKKDEDETFGIAELLNVGEATSGTYNNKTYIATPIMGLNTQLGVLIIEVD